MAETAYKEGDCRICGKRISKGSPIAFAEGRARDGHAFTAPIHLECATGFGPASMAAGAAAALPVALPKPKYVNVGAWVRIEDAPDLLAKIAELAAREAGGERE